MTKYIWGNACPHCGGRNTYIATEKGRYHAILAWCQTCRKDTYLA